MADYSSLLRDRVTLTCRSIDRIFLQGYVPKLQSVGLVCRFLRWQRGFFVPSSAAFGTIGDAYVAKVHQFAEAHAIPVVQFKKRENKEAVARPLIDAAAEEGGSGKVVLIGIVREKASVWRSWKAKGQERVQHPHMEWGRQMAMVMVSISICGTPIGAVHSSKRNAYAPYPIWLWLNGHSWAQRQLEKAGIAYEALDNGFRTCGDASVLQKTCEGLSPAAVQSFLERWWRRLPSPFTEADVQAGYGYGYEMAFRQ